MERSTVTALARAMGGSVLHSDKTMTIYQFPTEAKTTAFRDKIVYVSLWGGQGTVKNCSPLNVYFDQLK